MNAETLKKKVQVVIIAEESLLLFEFNNQIPNNYVGFQNITGSVEGEESFTEAAVRELAEEAGIDSTVIDIDKEFSFFDRWKKHCVEKVYLCYLDKRPAIVLNEEHLFSKWVPMNDVIESDFTFPTNFEAFLSCKKYIQEKKR
ncbi:NUDIX domain-containing protein [Bacteriovorax sp. PP10]|uniref:NUDIX domain-containing protein n=1 Tax=Bacteriovorax antarcticus TaxID=3088717 RepID=A0ABU5VUR8_9BACT|nr:NUDIX domain-containing protein [Bacteriovorax sp. PP10]MEA9356682.1 NUDIX domain-containing protein [Bacteriovorax sp. PP10]